MTSFIWDLDGTLLDSYDAILAGIEETYAHYDLEFNREAIRSFILQHSVWELLEKVAAENDLDARKLNAYRGSSLQEKNAQIHLMAGAKEVLTWAEDAGIANFVYTHKGANAHQVLADLGIAQYFTKIVTSADGFARKPHPAAIDYLVEKYDLDKASTYYIGDRRLDVEVAIHAGIQSINFQAYPSPVNQEISILLDIKTLKI
ncbi:HAD-IA family hydrolase [Streptococcus himalayensis]|uniref:Haloacid dehalogenase n=1 Tax=Streptococcus himalayensis TaxID=1888195 RepID=A0A917A7A1_9STRE|nr:HAD-IA family hydrolase [Streptococcus himalayensis]GGE32913.1 haloacid dehalogenase [Streptococcus himalayensis]